MSVVRPEENSARRPGRPAEEYARRLALRREEAVRLAGRDRRIANLRLAVFSVLVAFAWLVFASRSLPLPWLGLPALSFAALLLLHDRVIRARDRAERAVAFYERGLARIEHRFAGQGETGEGHREAHHPYAEDLDLFGRGSLFELLCTARTRAGEEHLAEWLRRPAAVAEVRARQEAVEELRERLDLREDLSLLGPDVRAGLHVETLRAWGESPLLLRSRAARAAAPLLVAPTLLLLGGWIGGWVGPIPALVAAAAQAGFASALRGRVQRVARSVEAPLRQLDLLASLLARVEAESFRSPRLLALRCALDAGGSPPSRRIAALDRLVGLLDARRNQFFAPIGALLLWTTQVSMAVERWRAVTGPALGTWVEALGEFEALASLAGHAFEHPDHPFPEFVEEGPLFEGTAVGHPLIAPSLCIRNDVFLERNPGVLVVTGSNMSGKSTLLRTVGVNAVLAQAGAPVCADALRLSPLAVGASIRVVDSLQEGDSHFYAEIKRIRTVMELADAGPTLFLLDEIFHGTNSHDRGIGAAAVLRGLLERGAIGLVTTHDLALSRIATELAPRAANVHFLDHVEEGRIAFDYRMRPGVVTRSNALALMRAVGLPV